jgi:hypothetical protein
MTPKLQIVQIVLQALTSFAIAGGLIFTAFQFRNARKAQLVANFSKLVELQAQLRYLRVEKPSLASERDAENLQSDQEIQEFYINLIQLSIFEIAWYAHKLGQLPPDYFTSWKTRMQEVAQEPAFRGMLDNSSVKIMHDDFDEYMRRLVKAPVQP